MDGGLETWLAGQERVSAKAVEGAVSARGLTHFRPAFAQTIVPAAGSVLASPVRALWDPEPDYFYHWVRDAAVAMMSAAILRRGDPAGWQRRFTDYVGFSLTIARRRGPSRNPLHAAASHRRFLRPDAELAALAGDALLGEPRVNADGAVDAERWSRPQFDGPALRALSCLRWGGPAPAGLDDLVALDLDHVLRHAAEPSIGPWEEDVAACHGFTLLAQRAALHAGAGRLGSDGVATALARIEAALDRLWDEEAGCLRASSAAPAGVSDASVVLGVLLEPSGVATFGASDPRVAATAAHIERWSREAFPVATETAPLVGRWPGDRYFGGNPWLPTSFGFAELHYRCALEAVPGEPARCSIARGDAFLEAVRARLPEPGPLPEQLDRDTGAPASCRDLTWSHAALLLAIEARRAALRRQAGTAAGS